MVSKQKYESIQTLIMSIINGAGSSIDPVDLLAHLRREGVSRELGSAIMWEMIGAGYISRSKDWSLSPRRELEQQAEVLV